MKHRTIGWSAALLCALVCALVLAACSSSTSPGRGSAATSTPTQSPVGTLGTFIPVGGLGDIGAAHLEEGGSSTSLIWIHDGVRGLVTRFDPTANPPAVVATVHVGQGPGQVAVGLTTVWVANHDDGTVMRIDPHNDLVVATIALAPGQIGPLDISPDAVWAVNTEKNLVYRIDQETNKVVATIATPASPSSISFGAGSVWVCARHGGQQGLIRIDPQTNSVAAQIDVGNAQGYQCKVALARSGVVWAEVYNTHTNRTDVLERIDPATNQVVATVPVEVASGDGLMSPFAVDSWGVWICAEVGPLDGFVLRIDPQTNQTVGTLRQDCQGVISTAGLEWLIYGPGGGLVPLRPAY